MGKGGMTMDLKTIITLIVIIFGAGGGWYSLKVAVDDVKDEIKLMRETQAIMENKLDAVITTDAVQDEKYKTIRRDVDRNMERIGP